MNRFLSAIWVVVMAATLCILTVEGTRSATPDDSAKPPAKQNWLQATGDWGNTRYSDLSQINTQTVKNLSGGWVSEKFDDAGTSRVTPVVQNGVMYLTAG